MATFTITLANGVRETLCLDSQVQDACARQLLANLGARRPGLVGELICYLGLFRPRLQELRFSRQLALADDVLALAERHGDQRVTEGLGAVLDALLPRSREPDWQPLRNHRYLEQVLARAVAPAAVGPASSRLEAGSTKPRIESYTAQALRALHEDQYP